MLLVRTRIGPSAIHGLGVFADEPIPAGTVVWKFAPGWDIEHELADLEALPPHVRAFLDHYGYVDRNVGTLVLCFDDARFMNHSQTPNIAPDDSGDPYGTDRAVVDIAAGDEITADYSVFERSR